MCLSAENIQFIVNNSESKCIIVSNKFHLNKVLKIWNKCKSLQFVIVMNELEEAESENVYSFSDIKEKGKLFGKDNPNHFKDNLLLSREDDLCTIIYTSGTTGEPKGVMLSHKNIMSNVRSAHIAISITPEDSFLSFLPLCHIFERTVGYYIALSGGCTVAFAESIEKVAQNLVEIKPTIMTAVPRLFERMYSKIIKNVESQSEKKQKIFNWAIRIGQDFEQKR